LGVSRATIVNKIRCDRVFAYSRGPAGFIYPLPLLHGLARELKELRRTLALEVWGNRYAVKALEEISRAYRDMLVELVDYALRHKASLKMLNRVFYCSKLIKYRLGLNIHGYPRGLSRAA